MKIVTFGAGLALGLAALVAGAAAIDVPACVQSVKTDAGGAVPPGWSEEGLTKACSCLGEKMDADKAIGDSVMAASGLPAGERPAKRSPEANAAIAACFGQPS
ncbi:MAG: hypothetical protein H6923_09140 [Alphaproteobacteria bacterium]|nr:hypothetical protein [Alphaproteobacteria bacterium]